MNLYFVDFENVNSGGLEGIEKLNEQNEIFILYSKNADTIKLPLVDAISKSKAKLSFIKINVLGENSLDFQLSVLIGLCIEKFKKENLNIHIISKDKGYNCLCEGIPSILKTNFEENIQNISIQTNINIKETLNNHIIKLEDLLQNKKQSFDKVKARLRGTKYQNELNNVIKIIENNLNKDKTLSYSKVHNDLVSKYKDKGKNIYQLIKKDIKEDVKTLNDKITP